MIHYYGKRRLILVGMKREILRYVAEIPDSNMTVLEWLSTKRDTLKS